MITSVVFDSWALLAWIRNEPSAAQQVAGLLPWFHNLTLRDKTKDPEECFCYAQAAAEHGWNRNILVRQIERDL